MTKSTARAGFSLVEVIVAMLILSVGILAMATSTGYVLSQLRSSQVRTERVMAMSQAAETLRGTAFSNLGTTCDGSPFLTSGRFTVSCTVSYPSLNLAQLQLVSIGPGYEGGSFATSVPDTFGLNMSQPVQ